MTAEFPLAIHALAYLEHSGHIASSAELAENICTNPARVRKVLARLHRAGLLTACEGKGSGYCALENGACITLAQVMHALGEDAVCVHWRSGDLGRSCQICAGMAGVMDGVYGKLNEACLTTLDSITIGDVLDQIFHKGA
jgi:DNA-binding IscR family transcriptional regulator